MTHTNTRNVSRFTLLLATAALLLTTVGASFADTTELKVTNSTEQPITVWVTLGAVTGCVKIPDLPFITHPVGTLQGSFSLPAGQTQAFPTDKGCVNGNLAFGSAPNNCAPSPGINLAEFNLNNGTEAIDISAVTGVNAKIEYSMTGGGTWSAGGHPQVTSFENQALHHNVGQVGVFPYSCTNCVNSAQKPSCVPDSPCNTERICNVERPSSSSGGTVTITFQGFLE